MLNFKSARNFKLVFIMNDNEITFTTKRKKMSYNKTILRNKNTKKQIMIISFPFSFPMSIYQFISFH